MAGERDEQDLMHYEALTQDALRGVVRAALRRAGEPGGMPGAHHFYITIRTRAPGVSAPADLIERYPEEMTIVLQHQYWDLTVAETSFSVTLKFGGSPKTISAPYAALTRFYDPSVQFLLQFDAGAEDASQPAPTGALTAIPLHPDRKPEPPPQSHATEEGQADAEPASTSSGPKIVSLDQFRKK